jgi:glycosyltransferase involved in cell wall biosynthesis
MGGGERHLVDLVSGLQNRGHQLHAVLRPHSPLSAALAPEGSLIATLPLRNAFDVLSARRLAALVSRERIQIIHAHLARDYPLAAYAVRQNPNVKLIVTRHVLFPLNRLQRLVLAHATRVIAVSEAVARALRAQALMPAELIKVVPNGIDVDRLAQARAQFDDQSFRARWNLPQDHLLIGSVGEIRPLKGHSDFLRAAALIVSRIPNSYFLIAGVDPSRDGEHQAALEKLIVELELSNNVRLFGWLEDLPSFYCALDVFVSASHSESFGLAIAEALACGTPVIATRTEGAEEILSPESSGTLVPVKDAEALAQAVCALLENQGSHRLANAGSETVRQRLSLARMIEGTEEVYQEALRS